MSDDAMESRLMLAAERVRAAHPDRPDVEVVLTYRLQPRMAGAGVSYRVRTGWPCWQFDEAGDTPEQAADAVVAAMRADPLARLRAAAKAVGHDLVKTGGAA